ncbi:hypothetical protein H477_2683 [[Clostridium] sordellii ATCC 9714]|nr:hypothetical protein H477_2683 [[Clostridium] sordellii ATCC 9714] [Paeniclostridium sordellii ATCC 9714]
MITVLTLCATIITVDFLVSSVKASLSFLSVLKSNAEKLSSNILFQVFLQ